MKAVMVMYDSLDRNFLSPLQLRLDPYTELFMMVGMVLIANVADFEEWRNGQPMVGMVNSASSFGAKVGSGIGSGIIGWVLALFGYASQAAEQSASALQGVLVISNWIPGIMIAILLVLMLAFDLDKKYPHYREELQAKHEGGATEK